MENFENEVFGFGNNTNEDLEQTNDFNYNSISGLGESDYENEDLFSVEVNDTEVSNDNSGNDFRIGTFDNGSEEVNNNFEINEDFFNNIEDFKVEEPPVFTGDTAEEPITQEEIFEVNNVGMDVQENVEFPQETESTNEIEELTQEESTNEPQLQPEDVFEVNNIGMDIQENIEVPQEIESANEIEELTQEEQTNEPQLQPEDVFEVNNIGMDIQENIEVPQEIESTNEVVEESKEEEPVSEDSQEEINISETPIEELNKLTEYKEDKIEETDINSLFDKVSVNVKDASDIFRRNTDLKQKIDTRFEELKKLQSEIENSRKKQLDEVNSYKEEVLNKLTEKKEEIEKRLNLLKESQASLEKEKQEFEQYKKKEKENIDKVQKEVQAAYDDRREELGHIEDVLRKQKDALDEERSQLSLDRIQYESDKNELANNLLKFNELVNSFTSGVNEIKE